MKVYVSELPKKCEDCPFYKLDTYVNVYGYQTNSHECVLDGSMLTNSCPLQSLAEHDKQVRKEVVQEINAELYNKMVLYNKKLEYSEIALILNQIQGENNGIR